MPPISRYFHVASKALAVALKWMSGTAANVSASVAIQRTPRWRAWWAVLMSPRIASRSETNTRFGRSVRILR